MGNRASEAGGGGGPSGISGVEAGAVLDHDKHIVFEVLDGLDHENRKLISGKMIRAPGRVPSRTTNPDGQLGRTADSCPYSLHLCSSRDGSTALSRKPERMCQAPRAARGVHISAARDGTKAEALPEAL